MSIETEETAKFDSWDESLRGKKMSDASGRVIYKYQMPVLERFTMKLPLGAKILRVKDEGGMFWLWAEVRTDARDEERKFWAFKTGGKIPDDLNFIWSNSDPTIFWIPENTEDLIDLPCDHQKSLDLLDDVCENWLQSSVYPEKHLLALNQYVIHKCAKASKSGVRTFVKISISKNKYDMKGNSVNHLLNYDWKYFERCASRNLQSSFENIGLKTKI